MINDFKLYEINDILDKKPDFSNHYINNTNWRKSHKKCNIYRIDKTILLDFQDYEELFGKIEFKEIIKLYCLDCNKWTIYEFDYLKLSVKSIKTEILLKIKQEIEKGEI